VAVGVEDGLNSDNLTTVNQDSVTMSAEEKPDKGIRILSCGMYPACCFGGLGRTELDSQTVVGPEHTPNSY
jgi:hypothetical protein